MRRLDGRRVVLDRLRAHGPPGVAQRRRRALARLRRGHGRRRPAARNRGARAVGLLAGAHPMVIAVSALLAALLWHRIGSFWFHHRNGSHRTLDESTVRREVRTADETVTSQQGGHHLPIQDDLGSRGDRRVRGGARTGGGFAAEPRRRDRNHLQRGRELTSRRLLGVRWPRRPESTGVLARPQMSVGDGAGLLNAAQRSRALRECGRRQWRRRRPAGQLIRDAEAANTRSLRVIPSCEVERSACAPRRRSHCMLIARAPDVCTESGARRIVRRRLRAPLRYWSDGASLDQRRRRRANIVAETTSASGMGRQHPDTFTREPRRVLVL